MTQDLSVLGTRSTTLPAYDYDPDELGGGISAGYGVVSFSGKEWAVRYRGHTEPMRNLETGEILRSVEVVLIRSGKGLAKTYFAKGFIKGSTERPDCWSSNAITPDKGVPSPQSPACATCPHNEFGSRISASSSKGKACSDAKRVAIVPLAEMANRGWGGPMLLRVPPDSLRPLEEYSQALKQEGFPYFEVGTRISFAEGVEHQKLVFRPIRKLEDDEVLYIRSLRHDAQVVRIVDEEMDVSAHDGDTSGITFEQPPQPAPKPAPAPPRPAPAPPRPAPVPNRPLTIVQAPTAPPQPAPALVTLKPPVPAPRVAKPVAPPAETIASAVAAPTQPPARKPAPPAAAPAEFEADLDDELAKLLA